MTAIGHGGFGQGISGGFNDTVAGSLIRNSPYASGQPAQPAPDQPFFLACARVLTGPQVVFDVFFTQRLSTAEWSVSDHRFALDRSFCWLKYHLN